MKKMSNEERYASGAMAIAKAIEYVSDTGDVELVNEIMDDAIGVMSKIAQRLQPQNQEAFSMWLQKKADSKLSEIKEG
jgi:hypothetical protein